MKKFFAIFAVAAMLFSCEEPVPETTLSLDNEANATLNLSTEAVEKVVTFTTNAAWTAAADAAWITVAPAEGVAGTAIELTINVAANDTFDNRAGKVTITAGDKVAEIAVNQVQTDEVNVGDAEILYVGYEGGEVELPVNHNIEYTVTSDADWAVVGGTRALTTTTTVINVAMNTTGAERTATLLVEAAGFEYEVYLTQSGKAFSTTVCDVLGAQVTTFTSGPMSGNAMVSIAVLGDKLVVCPGNGEATKLLDKTTGEVVGTLNTGDFVPYYVESDDAGNLVMCNRNLYDPSTGWWTADFQVYYMTSETATPVQLINGAQYGAIGAAFDVRGDVTADALILAAHEGLPDISMGASVEVWQIAGGVAGESTKATVTGISPLWGAEAWNCTPHNFPSFALVGDTIEAGALYGFYDNNNLHFMDGNFASTVVAPAMYDWQRSLASIDIHNVNGAPIAAITGGDLFADYGASTPIYILNVATQQVVATLATFNQATDWVLNEATSWYTFWPSVNATADITFETIDGGLVVYYIDNNHNSIEGLVVGM